MQPLARVELFNKRKDHPTRFVARVIRLMMREEKLLNRVIV